MGSVRDRFKTSRSDSTRFRFKLPGADIQFFGDGGEAGEIRAA